LDTESKSIFKNPPANLQPELHLHAPEQHKYYNYKVPQTKTSANPRLTFHLSAPVTLPAPVGFAVAVLLVLDIIALVILDVALAISEVALRS
jgi:hypothetical protein